MAAKSSGLMKIDPIKLSRASNSCDYFLVLLSESSALSEMVIEEVRRIKSRQDQMAQSDDTPIQWPLILPIRINFRSMHHSIMTYIVIYNVFIKFNRIVMQTHKILLSKLSASIKAYPWVHQHQSVQMNAIK